MKLFLSAVFLLCFCSIGRAENFDINNRIWRSSFTETGEQGAFVASGTLVVAIDVQSAGSLDASLKVYDGSMSAATAIKKQDIDTSNNSQSHAFVVNHSSGLIYSNSGTTPAKVRILWDWYTRPQPGHENDGR